MKVLSSVSIAKLSPYFNKTQWIHWGMFKKTLKNLYSDNKSGQVGLKLSQCNSYKYLLQADG